MEPRVPPRPPPSPWLQMARGSPIPCQGHTPGRRHGCKWFLSAAAGSSARLLAQGCCLSTWPVPLRVSQPVSGQLAAALGSQERCLSRASTPAGTGTSLQLSLEAPFHHSIAWLSGITSGTQHLCWSALCAGHSVPSPVGIWNQY